MTSRKSHQNATGGRRDESAHRQNNERSGKGKQDPAGDCFRLCKTSSATGHGSRTRLDRLYPFLWDSLVTEIQSISSVSDRTKKNLSNPRTVTSMLKPQRMRPLTTLPTECLQHRQTLRRGLINFKNPVHIPRSRFGTLLCEGIATIQ